jgi:hypothetical protein
MKGEPLSPFISNRRRDRNLITPSEKGFFMTLSAWKCLYIGAQSAE